MKRSKGIATASVAAALVLAACGGSSVPATTEALLPIATSSTLAVPIDSTASGSPDSGLSEMQQSVVARLIEAHGSGDPESVIAMWSDDGSHYRWGIEFDVAMGGRWTDVDCVVTAAGQPRCDLMYTNDLLAALEAPPLAGYFRLDISEDGAIAGWDYDTGNRSTTAAYLQPFSDWVEETDADAADRMFDWNGFVFRNVESYALWISKVDEYLTTLG